MTLFTEDWKCEEDFDFYDIVTNLFDFSKNMRKLHGKLQHLENY